MRIVEIIMNVIEYQRGASRTLNNTPDLDKNILVYTLGLGGEVGEVQTLIHDFELNPPPDKLSKELGDVLWYIAALSTTLNLDMARLPYVYKGNSSILVFSLQLGMKTSIILEIIKKHIGHGHLLDEALLRTCLGTVLRYVIALCEAYNLNVLDVMSENLAKLEKRYPQGFSHEASKNRLPEPESMHGACDDYAALGSDKLPHE